MAKSKVKKDAEKEAEKKAKEPFGFVIDHFLTVRDVAECPANYDEYEVTEKVAAEIPRLVELGLKVGDKFFYPRGK